MREIWKQHPIYSKYHFSTHGNCINHKGEPVITKTKHCRLFDDQDSRVSVDLAKLIAETHIPNPMSYEFVKHVDGNHKNNHIHNIEWCETSSDNLKGFLCDDCQTQDYNLFYPYAKKYCKICYTKRTKQRNQEKSPEEKELAKIKQKVWNNNNLIKIRVLGAKQRAKKNQMGFDIDEDYVNQLLVQQDYKCKYSGEPLQLSCDDDKNTRLTLKTISIERIDPTIGYVKGNVVLVTSIVNSMKNDLSITQFFDEIEIIYKNIKATKELSDFFSPKNSPEKF